MDIKKVRIDELIRSKRKTLSISIDKDARLVVRAPLRMSLKEIEAFVDNKKDWVIEKKQLVKSRKDKKNNIQILNGGTILFMGRHVKISTDDKVTAVTLENDTLRVPAVYHPDMIEKWLKKQAKSFLSERLSEISRQIDVPFAKSRISGARRCWGSCSGQNTISLSWRLIMAEKGVIDYVIIHELCHVIHKNHSPVFWNKVQEYIPDYRVYRKWLKENSYILDTL